MSFGSAKGMARRLPQFDQYPALVLDMTDVPMLDYTTARALEDMIHYAQATGREALSVAARPPVAKWLAQLEVLEPPVDGPVHAKRIDALRHAPKPV